MMRMGECLQVRPVVAVWSVGAEPVDVVDVCCGGATPHGYCFALFAFAQWVCFQVRGTSVLPFTVISAACC